MLRDPFDFWSAGRDTDRLRREMNRIFETWDRSSRLSVANGYPAMNAWANEDSVVLTAEIPGIDPQNLDISVRENLLTLTGERKPIELAEGEIYHRRELGYGKFQRVFQLPFQVDAAKVNATYEKGVLKITLPRAEADKPKRITVKAS